MFAAVRRIAALLLVALVATLALGATAASAATTGTGEGSFVAKINAARAAVGRPALTVSSDLVAVARAQSARMAAAGKIWHNPNLTTDVKNWRVVGENVGQGPTVSDLHTAFMNSPMHRANILDSDYTQVGIGTVVSDSGQIFVTEVFRTPRTAVAAKPAAPKAPAPVAKAPAAKAPAAKAPVAKAAAAKAPAAKAVAAKAVAAKAPVATPAVAPATAPVVRPTLTEKLATARAAAGHASPAAGSGDPLARVAGFTAAMAVLAA